MNAQKIVLYYLALFYWLATGAMWQDYIVTKRFPLYVAIVLTIIGVIASIVVFINED